MNNPLNVYKQFEKEVFEQLHCINPLIQLQKIRQSKEEASLFYLYHPFDEGPLAFKEGGGYKLQQSAQRGGWLISPSAEHIKGKAAVIGQGLPSKDQQKQKLYLSDEEKYFLNVLSLHEEGEIADFFHYRWVIACIKAIENGPRALLSWMDEMKAPMALALREKRKFPQACRIFLLDFYTKRQSLY